MTDSFTMPELKVILDHRINTNAESAEHLYKFNDREYVILPKVFSPAYFPNTHWFTHTFLMNMPTCSSFLEIGTGAGNVLIEAILSGKVKDIAMGTDINKIAIDNA
jgi:methylase of polypeptide subunit release factors